MHSIEGIRRINAKAVARYRKGQAETETSRHSSYTTTAEGDLILHSAKQRSTAFVSGKSKVKQFMAKWLGTNSATAHDALVESYFEHSPRC